MINRLLSKLDLKIVPVSFFIVFACLFSWLSVASLEAYFQTVNVRPAPPAMQNCTFAYATGGSNVVTITFTARNANGTPIPFLPIDFYLSSSASGVPVTTVASSSASPFTVSTGSLLLVTTTAYPATSALPAMTGPAGTYVVSYTDSNKPARYPVVVDQRTGAKCVGTVLATANYGYLIMDAPDSHSSSPLEESYRTWQTAIGKDRG